MPKKNENAWSKQRCKQVFISTQIGFTDLSKQSGVSARTLLRWSNADTPNWYQLREALKEEAVIQSREVIKDRLVREMADLSVVHLDTFREMREAAQLCIKAARIAVKRNGLSINEDEPIPKRIHPEFEKQFVAAVAQIPWGSLEAASRMVERAIEGERKAFGMDYLDINRAIRAVERTGLKVVVPDGSDLIRVGSNDSNSQIPQQGREELAGRAR